MGTFLNLPIAYVFIKLRRFPLHDFARKSGACQKSVPNFIVFGVAKLVLKFDFGPNKVDLK